jgi:hypothetical protein
MSDCVVYWLHDDSCVCPWRHGYIGISARWKYREADHRRSGRWPEGYLATILFRGNREECLATEKEFRPVSGVGWNRAVGGKPIVLLSEASRARMREARLRQKLSETTREKLRVSSTGRTNRGRVGQKKSEEERRKIALTKTGKKMSDEACRKLSERMIGKRCHLGHHHSEETKRIIAMKKIGIPVHSEETKQRRAERWKGNTLTKGQPWSAARRLAWLQNKEN